MDHHQARMLRTPTVEYDDSAVMDVGDDGDVADRDAPPTGVAAASRIAAIDRTETPARKTRSLSDGGGTPQKPTTAQLLADARRTSKDDSAITIPIRESVLTSTSNAPASSSAASAPPVTPHRSEFPPRGLALQLGPQASTPPAQQSALSNLKPAPLSPQLDHSQIYSSPTNILPRRSRGLDFSRAATSLHHTTIAEQTSPSSSPTVGGRGITIPGRRPGDISAPEQTSNSLWSMMGNQERHHISSSLGSAANIVSDSSSSSDEDDIMDEDMEEPYLMTPQVPKTSQAGWSSGGAGSSAVNSLLSFQQRQRPRKQLKKLARGSFGGMGLPTTPVGPSMLSKSPPTNMSPYGNMAKEIHSPHARRESISWAANQLNISGSESEDSPKPGVNVDGVLGPGSDGQNRVVRRTVTRRSNMLPKSKNFARVRLALAEEGTPVESEFRREAEVVRQVRESDMDLEQPRASANAGQQSSPNMPMQDSIEDDAMMVDSNTFGQLSSFKQQAQKNSKGRVFWDTFSETSSMGGARITPPPPGGPPRGSISGMSLDEMNMDSPSLGAGPSGHNGFMFPVTTTSSSAGDTPQPSGSSSMPSTEHHPPSAAEITRRFNMGKRRRDDDLDPVSFKRRAVSPGMSVHNSPILQSPAQHVPWASRPGSNGGSVDRAGTGTPSDNGAGSGSGGGGERASSEKRASKGRVGFQGMIDTNDGITRLSIE